MVGQVICGASRLYLAGPHLGVGLAKSFHFFSGCVDHHRWLTLFDSSPPADGTLKHHRLVSSCVMFGSCARDGGANPRNPRTPRKHAGAYFRIIMLPPTSCSGF